MSCQIRYIKMFNNFLTRGTMTSTYKAVFLRALTDIGRYNNQDLVGDQWIERKQDKIILDLNFIAIRFAKYYWDMHVGFGMRHMPYGMADRKKAETDVRIITLIKSVIEKSYTPKLKTSKTPIPPTLEYIASEKMTDFRDEVIKNSIRRYVLKAVLTDMKGLYEISGKQHIEFDPDLVEFMTDHAVIIKNALNYTIAKHLEKTNVSAKCIALMIDNEMDFEKRKSLIKSIEKQASHIQS